MLFFTSVTLLPSDGAMIKYCEAVSLGFHNIRCTTIPASFLTSNEAVATPDTGFQWYTNR